MGVGFVVVVVVVVERRARKGKAGRDVLAKSSSRGARTADGGMLGE